VTESSAAEPRAGGRAVLRVVAGEATPEEIAAVVAAVAAATSEGTRAAGASAGTAGAPTQTSIWSAPGYAHRSVRATFAPGPDSWRTSFWPR
jgi:hypothetical protein